MMIPCLWSLLFGFDALTGVGWKGVPAAASFLVDIPRGLGNGIWRKQPYGLRLRIFPQPLGGALKNPNAAPTTPPCFGRWPRSSSLLFESCTVRHQTVVIPVDIPTRWEPRTNQSPTGALIAPPAAWPCCSRPVPSTKTKRPDSNESGCFGGALSTALEPNTSSRVTVLASSVKLKLSTTRSSKT